MERNNDGKKSRGSQSAGIAPDTRVLWHRLSPATHYRGKKISIWLMAGRHRSAKLYIYPHGEVRDRSHWRQSLLAFPGSEVAPEQEGSRCAALAAPGLWDAVPPPLCSTSDSGGGLPPWGCKSPSRDGLRGRDTGKVHPDSYRREVAALTLPISCAIHRARSLHQVGLAKKWDTTTASVRHIPTRPAMSPTVHWDQDRDKADLGLSPWEHRGHCDLEATWGAPGLICWPAHFINIC